MTGLLTSSVPLTGNTISSSDLTTIAIPLEVAKQLGGKVFASFDEFRGAIYESIGNSSYTGKFSSSNQTLMQTGRAKNTPDVL